LKKAKFRIKARVTAAPFLNVRPRKYLIRDLYQAFWLSPMSVFPVFIKSSSNLLALTCVPFDLEDVKEKKPIPNLHQSFIKPTCVNQCFGLY
jgi:hypothetical protein